MNNNEIKVFTNNLFGSVRATVINGDVWFVGKDVATALGYKDPNDAINTHCREEGVVKHLLLTNGGKQKAKYINQRNVIRLIMRSKLKQAELFQDWVEDEIIPSVLKYGAYIGEDANQDYIKYNYESIKHQVATLPVEQLEEYVVGCLEFHKQEETRIVKAPQAKCRKGTKWSKSESKMKIMQRLHDSLIQRQNDYLAEGKLGFAHEITPIVYKLKDAIKVLCNNINGGQKASHTRATK